MPWQFGKWIRRPFQALFEGMEYYYNESRQLFDKIHAQDISKPEQLDQDLWMQEKHVSRACFIMGVAGIEAFANNVLRDFCIRKKEDLPKTLLSKKQIKKTIEWWSLPDKVYFLPTLCNRQLCPPAFYFKRNSEAFKLFEELVEIRNSIMHGRPQPFMVLINLKVNKKHKISDDFPGNFWPISGIAKDFTSFNYECAKTAHDNIVWVKDSLVGFLDKVNENYLKEEEMRLVSPIIPDGDVDKKELLKNWKTYVIGDA